MSIPGNGIPIYYVLFLQMDKLQISEILVKGARLEAIKLNEKKVAQLIDVTKQQQAEVLKLKEVDLENLMLQVHLNDCFYKPTILNALNKG